jgi:hypothetical protein
MCSKKLGFQVLGVGRDCGRLNNSDVRFVTSPIEPWKLKLGSMPGENISRWIEGFSMLKL